MEKEKMKLWKKILIVMLVLFAIFIILTARKFIIITRLVNASKEYENKTNYLATTSYVKGDMMYMKNSYNKDENYLNEKKFYGKSLDYPVIFTSYKNGKENLAFTKEEKIKK